MISEESSFKNEAARRETFENWPIKFLNTNDIAAAGFYYTHYKDVVCCAYCHVRLGQWERGDTALYEHRRLSPTCPFINGFPVGNELATVNNKEKVTCSRDVCGTSEGKHICLYLFCYMCVYWFYFCRH